VLCSECGKRPATVHYTQIINGEKAEIQVCDICAQKEGYSYIKNSDEPFSLHELLTGIFNVSSQANKAKTGSFSTDRLFEQFTDLKCEQCQLSFSEFQRIGKFGCANCYEAFKPRLNSVIRRVHSGNTKHHGKIPKRQGGTLHLEKEITELREYLQELVEEEKFEQAALIRDRIKELEEQKGGQSS